MQIRHRPLTEYDKPFRIGKSAGTDFYKGELGYPYYFIALKTKVFIIIK
jgi:hypothetical protein